MNNETQNASTSASVHEELAGLWGFGVHRRAAGQLEASDYSGEDSGCRGYARGHSAEFKQILRVLAGCES